jgi:shikimate kinase
MGCGKTTHGKKLAKTLGYQFVDLDKQIELKYNSTVSQLFQDKGEVVFRNIETEMLSECIVHEAPTVISLGGGTPCFNDNLKHIKTNGLLVYIKMDAKSLFNRLKNAARKRPLLKGKTDDELLTYIDELLQKREEYYQQADIIVNGINLNESVLKQHIEQSVKE